MSSILNDALKLFFLLLPLLVLMWYFKRFKRWIAVVLAILIPANSLFLYFVFISPKSIVLQSKYTARYSNSLKSFINIYSKNMQKDELIRILKSAYPTETIMQNDLKIQNSKLCFRVKNGVISGLCDE